MLGGEDARQLERVVELVREVLGPDVLGVYLFGSAVLGGLRPESDLDLLAVSARPTTLDEKRRVVERLLSISGRRTPEGRWRRVELTVVVAPDVRPWRFPPRFDLQYGDWLRSAFERGEVEPWPTNENPDLAVLLTMALLADRPVLGPPPAQVLDPCRTRISSAPWSTASTLHEDLDADTRNVVLTLARIWSTVATGEIRSKDAAAEWALPRLPEEHRAVLSRARTIYLGGQEEQWHDLAGRVRAHADYVAPRSVARAERHQVHSGSACKTSSRSAILAPLPVAARRSPSHEHPQQSPACPHGRRAPDRSRLPRMRGARR